MVLGVVAWGICASSSNDCSVGFVGYGRAIKSSGTSKWQGPKYLKQSDFIQRWAEKEAPQVISSESILASDDHSGTGRTNARHVQILDKMS